MINRDALTQWRDLNINGYNNANGSNPEYDINYEADANYYDIIERVSAGYLMNTFNFGQNLTVIAGLRVEKENNDYHSKYTPNALAGFPLLQALLEILR